MIPTAKAIRASRHEPVIIPGDTVRRIDSHFDDGRSYITRQRQVIDAYEQRELPIFVAGISLGIAGALVATVLYVYIGLFYTALAIVVSLAACIAVSQWRAWR